MEMECRFNVDQYDIGASRILKTGLRTYIEMRYQNNVYKPVIYYSKQVSSHFFLVQMSRHYIHFHHPDHQITVP